MVLYLASPPSTKRIGNPTRPERPDWPEKGRSRGPDAPSTRTGGAAGCRERCKRALSWLLGRSYAGQRRTTRAASPSPVAERRRFPGDALIKLDVGLALGEDVPVGHRPEIIVPGGWSADRGDRRRFGGLAVMDSMRGISAASVTKAILRAPAARQPEYTTGRTRVGPSEFRRAGECPVPVSARPLRSVEEAPGQDKCRKVGSHCR